MESVKTATILVKSVTVFIPFATVLVQSVREVRPFLVESSAAAGAWREIGVFWTGTVVAKEKCDG